MDTESVTGAIEHVTPDGMPKETALEEHRKQTEPVGPGDLEIDVRMGRASFSSRGAADSVIAAFQAFREFYAESSQSESVPPYRPQEFEKMVPSSEGAATEAQEVESVPLPVFLDQKKMPRGNNIIALGIAVWAKRYRSEDVIDADSARQHWRDSRRKVPSNIPRDLSAAASEGWLERLPTGGGKYSVTSYGEAHFDGLPDSES